MVTNGHPLLEFVIYVYSIEHLDSFGGRKVNCVKHREAT